MDSQKMSTIQVETHYRRKQVQIGSNLETVYRIDYVRAKYDFLFESTTCYYVNAEAGYRIQGSLQDGNWVNTGEAWKFLNSPRHGDQNFYQTKNYWLRCSEFSYLKGMFYGTLTSPGGAWEVIVEAPVPLTIMG